MDKLIKKLREANATADIFKGIKLSPDAEIKFTGKEITMDGKKVGELISFDRKTGMAQMTITDPEVMRKIEALPSNPE